MLTALPSPARTTELRRERGPREPAGPPAVVARPPYRLYAFEVGLRVRHRRLLPYLVPLVEARAAVPAELSGFLFAVPHLIYLLLMAPVHAAVSLRPLLGLRVGFILVAIGLSGHALADSAPGFVVARVALGLGLTAGLVSLAVLVADASRGRRPGRMFGWLELRLQGRRRRLGSGRHSSQRGLGAGRSDARRRRGRDRSASPDGPPARPFHSPIHRPLRA